MYSDAKKIHLLEKLIKTTDDKLLDKVEEILSAGTGIVEQSKTSAQSLSGKISPR